MSAWNRSDRRGFVARGLAATAAGWATVTLRASGEVEQAGGGEAWIKEVPGKNRCFFDCPQHMNGFGLLHILNYLSTYTATGAPAGSVGAASSFYGVGPGSSIALGFNDAMWAKYALGEYHGLKDSTGKPYTRNPFLAPTKADAHLLASRIQMPIIPMLGDAIGGLGIANLQKMGTKFLMCNNALGLWTLELEAKGKGQAAALDKELRANLVPGVTIVPAMVIAIDQAQAAGISYNRQ